MADPLTWAIIGITGVGIGATASVTSSVMAHEQQKANADMAADQARRNAFLEEREAKKIEQIAQENMRAQRLESQKLKARQRALLGKSGAALAAGSPLAILGQTAADEEKKALNMANAGYEMAQQRRNQAASYLYEGRIAKASAPSGLGLGISVAGTLGSAVANAAAIGVSAKK
jgi:hypothetical protein